MRPQCRDWQVRRCRLRCYRSRPRDVRQIRAIREFSEENKKKYNEIKEQTAKLDVRKDSNNENLVKAKKFEYTAEFYFKEAIVAKNKAFFAR